jgi:hypothetical protein
MPKTDLIASNTKENPFLTDKAGAIWEKLNKGGKRISKEELLERSKSLKKKN